MKTKGFLLAVAFAAMAFTFSCSSDDGESSGGSSPSGGGGGSFATVTIGTQTWMKQNLNSDVPGSKCYGDDPANCAKYGRLYDWATAMGLPSSCNSSSCSSSIQPKHRGICPSGWHIPSDDDWDALMTAVGGSSTAGTKLKSATGWNTGSGYKPGTDNYGFSALPGGLGSSAGGFLDVGDGGYWWSASEYNSINAKLMYMHNNGNTGYNVSNKDSFYSVRCLQD